MEFIDGLMDLFTKVTGLRIKYQGMVNTHGMITEPIKVIG
jgi:hypothetical protein